MCSDIASLNLYFYEASIITIVFVLKITCNKKRVALVRATHRKLELLAIYDMI